MEVKQQEVQETLNEICLKVLHLIPDMVLVCLHY